MRNERVSLAVACNNPQTVPFRKSQVKALYQLVLPPVQLAIKSAANVDLAETSVSSAVATRRASPCARVEMAASESQMSSVRA